MSLGREPASTLLVGDANGAPAASARTSGGDGGLGRALLARARALPLWVLVGAGLAATFLTLGLLGEALGGGPSGPVSSSYATDARGLAAWAELLPGMGHPVAQLRTPLTRAQLDPADTLVVLDPEALLPSEGARLRAFVRAGGRLVLGGAGAGSALPAVLPRPPQLYSPAAVSKFVPAAGAGVADVGEVRSAGEAEWSGAGGGYRPLLEGGAGAGALLLERRLGRGVLELVADASPLQNRLLGSADNAQLSLDLAGTRGRPVVFAESVHGFGASRGLAALPSRWWLAFAALALAGAAWVLARGRRLGPPERLDDGSPLPREAYVTALALLLERTHDRRGIARALSRLRDRG